MLRKTQKKQTYLNITCSEKHRRNRHIYRHPQFYRKIKFRKKAKLSLIEDSVPISHDKSFKNREKRGPFFHVSNHEYYGDNFISKPNPNPNPRYKVSIISHQY